MNVIEVKNLEKSYGINKVVKGISFEVREGEIFALLGVNGAGKTTTLECVEGLRRYNAGSIDVKGKVGIQLQSSSLPESIRPMEAIKLFAKWNKAEVNKTMLRELGIDELAKKNYVQLSTGQKRRLHLALALVGNPDIVFLDEPTAGLDVEGRASLHKQVRALKAQGKTIILASHDMAEVESLCDRIAILSKGEIVFSGTVDELTQKVGRKYHISIKILQEDGITEAVETCESENIANSLLELLEDYKKRGITILDVKVDRGTLEQHFIDLAGKEA